MSVDEQENTSTNGGGGAGGAGNAALKAAAAAAATGAATYAVKRIRSHDAGKSSDGDRGDRDDRGSSSRGKSGSSPSILASAAATSWEAAADALLPMAEDAAEAAGKYLATHGPEIVRDRIVPRFIEGFNDAK
jgi:hypothetical protein